MLVSFFKCLRLRNVFPLSKSRKQLHKAFLKNCYCLCCCKLEFLYALSSQRKRAQMRSQSGESGSMVPRRFGFKNSITKRNTNTFVHCSLWCTITSIFVCLWISKGSTLRCMIIPFTFMGTCTFVCMNVHCILHTIKEKRFFWFWNLR